MITIITDQNDQTSLVVSLYLKYENAGVRFIFPTNELNMIIF